VGACFLIQGALSALMSTMMMDRVSLKSPATDFTLQFSIYSLMMFIAAAGSTALAGHLGYLAVVMVACAFACLALVLALYRTFRTPTNTFVGNLIVIQGTVNASVVTPSAFKYSN